jgi:hypothetical protein
VLFLALFCIYVHNIFLKYTKKCVLTFNFSCSLLPQNLEIIYECIRSVKSVYILLIVVYQNWLRLHVFHAFWVASNIPGTLYL